MAYSWTGLADDNWDVYVKALGMGTAPLRLTDDPGIDFSAAWSPDGRRIAFVREVDNRGAIYTVPARGGQERKLVDLTGPVRTRFFYLPALSWSPDGRWLAYAEKPSKDEPARIVRLSLETLEKVPLASPPEDSLGDFVPSFSPDGTHVAFVRSASTIYGDLDLWLQPVKGGEARRLTSEHYLAMNETASWSLDGEEIFFFAGQGRGGTMWRVSLPNGTPQLVPGIGRGTEFFSVRGTRMVHHQRKRFPMDLWRVAGPGTPSADGTPERLIVSNAIDGNPDYSPDGLRVALVSGRSGKANVWICASDGSDPVQLTGFNGAGTPRWSPDGTRLTFDSRDAGDHNIYVIKADGGVPRRLTQDSTDEVHGTWSRDGRWIYFTSARSGSQQIWKIPERGGEAVQVTRDGGFYALESWDGRDLYFSKTDPPSLWRMPVTGGKETLLVQDPHLEPKAFGLSRTGLYFETKEETLLLRRQTYTIQYLPLDSGVAREVYRQEGPSRHNRFAVSADDEWLLFGQFSAATSELILAENFH